MKKKTNDEFSRIVLDAEISLGLQVCLAKGGFAKPESDSWIPRRALKRGERYYRRALDYLLLYDQVLIPIDDCWVELTDNASEFCKIMPDRPKWRLLPKWKDWALEYMLQISDTSKKIHHHYKTDISEIPILNVFTKKDINLLYSIRSFLLPYLRTRPSVFYRSLHSGEFDMAMAYIIKNQDAMNFWSDIGKKSRTERDKLAWDLELYVSRIFMELKQLEWLMSKSANLNVPVATPRVKIKKDKVNKKGIPPSDDSYWKAYQIYLEEIEIFPDLRTINDVIRLRQKPEIKKVRNSLREWSLCIRAGEENAEKEMRKEIKNAIHKVKRLGPVKKIGWWSAVMSLPIGIAELLIGSPGIGGLILASLGTASLIYSRKMKKQNDWFLIGN